MADEIDPGNVTMNFGKHKGERLSEIPVGYLDWTLGLSNLNPRLRTNIEAYLARQAEYDQMAGREAVDDREDYVDGED